MNAGILYLVFNTLHDNFYHFKFFNKLTCVRIPCTSGRGCTGRYEFESIQIKVGEHVTAFIPIQRLIDDLHLYSCK